MLLKLDDMIANRHSINVKVSRLCLTVVLGRMYPFDFLFRNEQLKASEEHI